MSQQNAFSRSRKLFAAIMAITMNGDGPLLQQFAINSLPAYKSRGKGGKHKAHRSRPNFNSGSSTTQKRHGDRETTRRYCQIASLTCQNRPSTPRRMWTVSAPLLMIEDFKSSTRKAAVKFQNKLSFQQFSSVSLV